jgi:pimeloyl-ACP methyl ester carboxylesterase
VHLSPLLSSVLALSASASPAQGASAPAPAASARLVAIHGHHISFHVTPGKTPAIVLDAGGGLDSTYWATLVPELAKRTGREIITYDRSGFGESEEVPGAWNLQRATDDLEAALTTLGATHGIILVSHSIAGEIASTLANRHPQWLAGAVSVDANIPDFFTDKTIRIMSATWAPIVEKAKADPSAKESRQLIAVAASFEETNRAFHKTTWPKTIPVVVIVSEKTPFERPADAQWWRDAHARFAKAAPNRRLVTAQRSSHDVAHDRPDLIIQAVVDLLGAGKP